MKVYRVFCLCSALALSQVTLGDSDRDRDKGREARLELASQKLGIIESLRDFCTRADPVNAAKFKREATGVARVADEEAVELRRTKAYKDEYRDNQKTLARIPVNEATATCHGFAQTLP